MWELTLSEHPQPLGQWGVVLGASLAAAITDLRSRRIPNVLTGPLYLAGLVTAGLVAGTAGVLEAFLASLLLALPFVLLFVFAGGGAGDAKLMGALGAWLGVTQGAVLLFCVSLAGVLLAVVYARVHGRLGLAAVRISGVVRSVLVPVFTRGAVRLGGTKLPTEEDGQKMPYGLAIFVGAVSAAGGVALWNN